MENIVIKFKCPYCQLPLAFHKPTTGYGVNITCPKCNNAIRIKVREKAIRLPEQEVNQVKRAHLLLIDGPQTDRMAYPLHHGDNIIGRDDPDTTQDIAIRGDMSISRRSASLEVVATTQGEGYSYRLRVLNAKNPVYINDAVLHTGDGISMRPGDVIQLGMTKLMLEK